MPHAQSQNAKIYYESHGGGPAVLFVHGAGGNHAAWWQQTAHFMPDHRVLTLDLRGFGNSDSVADGPDSQDFPHDILAVLDAARVERVVLVGQSIGAAAALKAAVLAPHRAQGVILAHSLGGISHPELVPLVKADRALAEKLPVIDRLLTRTFQETERARTFLFKQMGTFNKATMQDLRNLTSGGPTLEQIEGAGIKIRFLAGERDAVLSPATVLAAEKLVKGSRANVIPNAPHSMYWEVPELFNAAVRGFVRELYAA
jgi:pimeloyl-ACP methyl ester carboxylesterase